jgi:pimeloyl-ACP methyl ester carboxylesterase
MHEKIFVKINGIEQGMFLQSENIENPVLLFLHGGPGSPEIAFTGQYPTGLDKIFTVCWWEQRGSGMSYNRSITKHEMTIEQMIADTIAVVYYLRKRFNKEKVYVMGHSWGSLLGVLTVKQAPQLFHAYIGIGQVAKQLESERLAYSFMLQKFRRANNKKMVRKLLKYSIDKGGEVSVQYLGVRNEGMIKVGVGITHHCTSMMECIMILLRFKGYTLKEKLKFPMGNRFSVKCLWNFVLETDLIKHVPELKIPMYIFQGKYDYQVSYVIAKEFALKVKAPIKGFYTFEDSAHSPCFEEPEKMCHILRTDVLQGKVDLSDNLINLVQLE